MKLSKLSNIFFILIVATQQLNAVLENERSDNNTTWVSLKKAKPTTEANEPHYVVPATGEKLEDCVEFFNRNTEERIAINLNPEVSIFNYFSAFLIATFGSREVIVDINGTKRVFNLSYTETAKALALAEKNPRLLAHQGFMNDNFEIVGESDLKMQEIITQIKLAQQADESSFKRITLASLCLMIMIASAGTIVYFAGFHDTSSSSPKTVTATPAPTQQYSQVSSDLIKGFNASSYYGKPIYQADALQVIAAQTPQTFNVDGQVVEFNTLLQRIIRAANAFGLDVSGLVITQNSLNGTAVRNFIANNFQFPTSISPDQRNAIAELLKNMHTSNNQLTQAQVHTLQFIAFGIAIMN